MSTVLRVKRRCDHEPLDALVIAGKKRKIDTDQTNSVEPHVPLTEIVKFAGTIKNPEEDVTEHIKKHLTKDELESNFKKRSVDITNKIRAKAKELSRENRYKVVKYFRSNDSPSSKDENESVVTVIDVEHTKLSNAENILVDDNHEVGYVYDLYYTQAEADLHLDDELKIHPYEQELVFDSYSEFGTRPEEDESDDSNSESNIRNDYPDSDHSENSIDDDDMKAAVRNLRINDEGSDLSSEDDFVYAINEDDVESYGLKYAKYKAKVKDELGESDEDSEESDYSLARDNCEMEERDEEDEKD